MKLSEICLKADVIHLEDDIWEDQLERATYEVEHECLDGGSVRFTCGDDLIWEVEDMELHLDSEGQATLDDQDGNTVSLTFLKLVPLTL